MADLQEMINSARDTVRGFLDMVDPEYQEYDTGMFTVQEGSAIIGITLRPWQEDEVAVEFSSQLVNGARLDESVLRWLLETNTDLHFGGFGLLYDGSIVYTHTVPLRGLDQSVFSAVARTVATIADHYDDEIVTLAGGNLASSLADEIAVEIESEA